MSPVNLADAEMDSGGCRCRTSYLLLRSARRGQLPLVPRPEVSRSREGPCREAGNGLMWSVRCATLSPTQGRVGSARRTGNGVIAPDLYLDWSSGFCHPGCSRYGPSQSSAWSRQNEILPSGPNSTPVIYRGDVASPIGGCSCLLPSRYPSLRADETSTARTGSIGVP